MSKPKNAELVVVIKPGLASEDDKDRLRAAGYVVIESDDQSAVRVINLSVLPNSNMITRHLLTAITSASYKQYAQSLFAAGVLNELLEQIKANEATHDSPSVTAPV